MEKNLIIENEKNNRKLEIGKEQNNFLESSLGQAVNFAMDMGLRSVLPNFIEDEIISVKNTIFKEGLGEGIKSIINSGIELGKSVIGIFTGNFENVSQMQNAVQKGGIIQSTSGLLDKVLNKIQKNKALPKNVVSIIKNGKNILLDNISKKIENTFMEQTKEVENINKYSKKWRNFYEQKDFKNMEKEYEKLKGSLGKTVPLENIIKEARKIENIHNLIKNNGENFELTKNEIELANKLT